MNFVSSCWESNRSGPLSRTHSEGLTTKHTKDTKTRGTPLADRLNKRSHLTAPVFQTRWVPRMRSSEVRLEIPWEGREKLTARQVEGIIERHGEIMRRFGYLDSHDRLVG